MRSLGKRSSLFGSHLPPWEENGFSSVLETSANPARPSVNQAHPVGRLEGCFRAPHCRGPCGRSDMRCLSSVAADSVYF